MLFLHYEYIPIYRRTKHYSYKIFDLKSKSESYLFDLLQELKRNNFTGVNITFPFKEKVIKYAMSQGISSRAGHGLNFDKAKKILNINYLEELNIGHFIIGESIFYGLSEVVKKMKKIIG